MIAFAAKDSKRVQNRDNQDLTVPKAVQLEIVLMSMSVPTAATAGVVRKTGNCARIHLAVSIVSAVTGGECKM